MDLLVPGSRKAITNLFALGKETVAAQAYAASKGGKVESSYMVKNFPNYVKAGSYSVKEVMDAIKLPKKAQQIVSGYWCYLGAPMNEMNWQHYGSMWYRYITRGIVIPTKTSHNLSLALVERIRDLGSDVWF
ncbi:MAG: NAD(P)/FAD-dependent oxidoreductase, partial [Malacoplasma sp.]|nr:NAD(P)/FAD-dependent oxidoreductase [Malacoplasma sp.]